MNKVLDLIEGLHSTQRDYLNNYLMNAPKWLLDSFQVIHLKSGTPFIHENTPADTIFILVEGEVKATDYRVQEVAYDYTRFYPVEVFGAMEFLMDYDNYMTTLITETDCRFLRVSKDKFAKWMLTDIHAVLEQVRAMSSYLLGQARKERLYLFLQGIDRLFLLFMDMYKTTARNQVCHIRLTRKDLSNGTGLCIKTVNRCVKKMEEEGYISRVGRTICIDQKQYHMIHDVISEKIDEIAI